MRPHTFMWGIPLPQIRRLRAAWLLLGVAGSPGCGLGRQKVWHHAGALGAAPGPRLERRLPSGPRGPASLRWPHNDVGQVQPTQTCQHMM